MLYITVCLLFSACTNKLKQNYNPKTFETDLVEIKKEGKATEEDLRLLAQYVIISRLENINIEEKSYQDILDQMKTLQKSIMNLSSRQQIESLDKKKSISK